MRSVEIPSQKFYKVFKLVLGVGDKKARTLSKLASLIVKEELNKQKCKTTDTHCQD